MVKHGGVARGWRGGISDGLRSGTEGVEGVVHQQRSVLGDCDAGGVGITLFGPGNPRGPVVPRYGVRFRVFREDAKVFGILQEPLVEPRCGCFGSAGVFPVCIVEADAGSVCCIGQVHEVVELTLLCFCE